MKIMKMKFVSLITLALVSANIRAERVDVYAQSFDAGGWSLDAQFMDIVGSPYLIAHGIGVRVTDAKARVSFPAPGEYRVWVRAKNWADGAPGRFRVSVDGKALAKEFGAGPREWSWEDGGVVKIAGSEATVVLEDLTGFDGRCAGIVFDSDVKGPAPKGALKVDAANVSENVKADFVVVGGGLPGTCAAVAAARRGLKVALIHDRPVLGGNGSSEIRVWSAGEARHDLIRDLRGRFMNRNGNLRVDDARRMRIVADEK
ncbi:MAG: FAD-dependent oxidoreductase, partial [Kiritimatiellae bacterium]|nr:FAD-dependent oxidoreductase [Kiritimatiellia bacterium]